MDSYAISFKLNEKIDLQNVHSCWLNHSYWSINQSYVYHIEYMNISISIYIYSDMEHGTVGESFKKLKVDSSMPSAMVANNNRNVKNAM